MEIAPFRPRVPLVVHLGITAPSPEAIVNLCKRCIDRGNNLIELQGDDKPFYCDVGMKSVLRAIRRHIFQQLKLLGVDPPKKCNYTEWPENFKAACITFYHNTVLSIRSGRAAALTDISKVLEEAAMVHQAVQALLDNNCAPGHQTGKIEGEIFLESSMPDVLSTGGCRRKAKQASRQLVHSRSTQSTFTAFNKKIFLSVAGNSIFQNFCAYIRQLPDDVLFAKVKPSSLFCR